MSAKKFADTTALYLTTNYVPSGVDSTCPQSVHLFTIIFLPASKIVETDCEAFVFSSFVETFFSPSQIQIKKSFIDGMGKIHSQLAIFHRPPLYAISNFLKKIINSISKTLTENDAITVYKIAWEAINKEHETPLNYFVQSDAQSNKPTTRWKQKELFCSIYSRVAVKRKSTENTLRKALNWLK